MSTTPQIVHTLNNFIAHVETQLVMVHNHICQYDHQPHTDEVRACILKAVLQTNDYKRALGQLKAARASIMSASTREVGV